MMLKKFGITVFSIVFLLSPFTNVYGTKFVRYTGGDYLMGVPNNLDDNKIAIISVDKKNDNKIETIEILDNENSKYQLIIDMNSDVSFKPRYGVHKMEFSGNFLAFTFRDSESDKDSIAVYDLSENSPKLLLSENLSSLNIHPEFSLYDNYIVFTSMKNFAGVDGYFLKPAYINLKDKFLTVNQVKSEDNNHYYRNRIYEDNIYYINENSIYSYNILSQKESKLTDIVGEKPKNLRVSDDYITYRSFLNDKKNLIVYNRKENTSEIVHEYPEIKNIDWVDLNNNYLTFFYRGSTENIKIYDLKNHFWHELKSDKFNIQYPRLSENLFVWISDREGSSEIYYASLNGLFNDESFLGVSKVFLADEKRAEALEGEILLQVEKNGEAWYVANKINDSSYYANDSFNKNKDRSLIVFLGRPSDAFMLMRQLGEGILNRDLEKIPANKSIYNKPEKIDEEFTQKRLGKIYLQVEKNGEAWYINPDDGKRYFLGRPSDAFVVMKNLGKGISNQDFNSLILK